MIPRSVFGSFAVEGVARHGKGLKSGCGRIAYYVAGIRASLLSPYYRSLLTFVARCSACLAVCRWLFRACSKLRAVAASEACNGAKRSERLEFYQGHLRNNQIEIRWFS